MAQSVEFQITSDLAVYRNNPVTANFDETQAALVNIMTPYAGMIVTEDGVSAAKSDLAKIRKVKSRINEVWREAKKECLAPLTAFEERKTELLAICETAESNLDEQIKGYDTARREEKLNGLREYFTAHVGDIGDYLTFSDIEDKRWGNVTYAEDAARSDIARALAKTRMEVSAIRAMNSEFETALLDEYRRTHDLPRCIETNKRLVEQQLRQRARELEERRAAAAQAQQTDTTPAAERPAEPQETADTAQPEAAPMVTVDFRVTATRAQLVALREFLQSNGIRYGKVPKEGR